MGNPPKKILNLAHLKMRVLALRYSIKPRLNPRNDFNFNSTLLEIYNYIQIYIHASIKLCIAKKVKLSVFSFRFCEKSHIKSRLDTCSSQL
jgi:hypothetical protein